jgi:hypothetical protein
MRPLIRGPVVRFRHLGLRKDDWVLAEYPKSGGTWLAFVLGEALFGAEVDFANQGRFMPAIGRHRSAPIVPGVGGRLVRTHERHRPSYGRAIYLVRHVADVALSYHRWLSWLGVQGVGFDEFLPEFLQGHVDGWGPWQRHVSSFLDAPPSTVHVVRYEDLRTDIDGAVTRILAFMGATVGESDLKRSIANNSIERMREKEARARAGVFAARTEGTNFVRSGAVGEGADVLSPDQMSMIERYAGPQLRRLGYHALPRT